MALSLVGGMEFWRLFAPIFESRQSGGLRLGVRDGECFRDRVGSYSRKAFFFCACFSHHFLPGVGGGGVYMLMPCMAVVTLP